ncbi:MAG: crossover junction endodeoxyribonuclease RuvC [Candidatus Andersenbacteria bacterium]
MVVIGIDPGIERTGYAVVEIDGHAVRALEYGCISTTAHMPMGQRLAELRQDLTQVLTTHKPVAAVIERLVFVHNATSALAVGQARGVIMLTLHEHGLTVREYSPTEVKRAVTSNGAADKQAVGQAVRLIFGLERVPTPDDAADALALAVCHAGQVQ